MTRPISRVMALVGVLGLVVLAGPSLAEAQTAARVSDQGPAPSDAGGTLGLEVVVASVERHHPNLVAAHERVRAAEGEALASDGGFDLTVRADGFLAPVGYYDWGRASIGLEQPTPLWGASFYGGWRIGRGDVPVYYGDRETLDGGELRIGARIPLLRDGPTDSRRARRARATEAVEAERSSVEAQRLALLRDAATRYFRWAAAGQRYQIAARLLEIAEARDGQIAAKVAAGHLPPLESLENRRVILARRTNLVGARRALERTAISLSLYLRTSDGSPRVPGNDELPAALASAEDLDVDLGEAVERAWARRPEFARYRALAARQQIGIELAENQRLPRVDFGIGASLDVGSGSAAAQDVLGPAVVEASLSFSMPVQRREARGAVARNEAELAALSAEQRYTRDIVEAQLRDAHSAVRAAAESVSIAREAAEVARAVAAAERARFELGATQLFVVNLREEAAAAAGAVLVDADAALHVAHVEWRAASGEL